MSELKEVLAVIAPHLKAALLAIVVAVIRIYHDDRKTDPMKVFLEALLCGCLALLASYAGRAMGVDPDWLAFTGGAIGYLGSRTVRQLAMRFIDLKIRKPTK